MNLNRPASISNSRLHQRVNKRHSQSRVSGHHHHTPDEPSTLTDNSYQHLGFRQSDQQPRPDLDKSSGDRFSDDKCSCETSSGKRSTDSKSSSTPSDQTGTLESNQLGHSWVRIPYPLDSFFKPTAVNSTSAYDKTDVTRPSSTPAKHSENNISIRGWFDLNATHMRELTVESVQNASNSVQRIDMYIPCNDNPAGDK